MTSWFWYFVFYSFIGFLLEILFARLIRHPKRDRKCLYLSPLCPVYGMGALVILWISQCITHPWLLLLLAVPSATLVEYGVAYFNETILGVRFWDYRGLTGHIHGRVCLFFSGIWCFLTLELVYVIHPKIMDVVSSLPLALGVCCFFFLALDSGYTFARLISTKNTDSLQWYHPFGGGETR